MLRRGVGISAVANRGEAAARTQLETMSRQLSEQRLADMARTAELLESGVRAFVAAHRDEIRRNAFLYDKLRALAETCNVDLDAATAPVERLKPSDSAASSVLSARAAQFLAFLASRVIALCVRERVLRGPLIPMPLVVAEMRKRYPAEDVTEADVVKALESLQPLNSHVVVLRQRDAAGITESTFVAFQPVGVAAADGAPAAGDAGAGASEALRIVALAVDLARCRSRAALEASRSTAATLGVTVGARPSAVRSSATATAPPAIAGLVVAGPSAWYVSVTVRDVVHALGGGAAPMGSAAAKPWNASRARVALASARELCEGWWDAVDGSTWLLV